jgi:branched-chain amino acid transport system substrate-binding protein
MLVKAITDAGPDLDPDQVSEALAGAEFDGVRGPIAIRAEDHLVEAPVFEYRLVAGDGGYHLEQVDELSFDAVAP